jgi:hypothetical protein
MFPMPFCMWASFPIVWALVETHPKYEADSIESNEYKTGSIR